MSTLTTEQSSWTQKLRFVNALTLINLAFLAFIVGGLFFTFKHVGAPSGSLYAPSWHHTWPWLIIAVLCGLLLVWGIPASAVGETGSRLGASLTVFVAIAMTSVVVGILGIAMCVFLALACAFSYALIIFAIISLVVILGTGVMNPGIGLLMTFAVIAAFMELNTQGTFM